MYLVETLSTARASGGRFNNFSGKTWLERLVREKRYVPGPGSTNPRRPATSGGRFNNGDTPSQLELTIHRAEREVGPADYHLDEFRRTGGGKFNDAFPKSYLDWIIYNSKATPGPAEYNFPDGMTALSRKPGGGQYGGERKMRHSQSAPGRASTAPPGRRSGGNRMDSHGEGDMFSTSPKAARTKGGPREGSAARIGRRGKGEGGEWQKGTRQRADVKMKNPLMAMGAAAAAEAAAIDMRATL